MDADADLRPGKSPGTLFSSAMSFASCHRKNTDEGVKLEAVQVKVQVIIPDADVIEREDCTISLFSLIFRALLSMKFSSSSESDS